MKGSDILMHVLVGSCMALAPMRAAAQADVHFSQFYETSVIRNPALVGVFTDNFKITGYVRNQWSSVTDPYQTALANGEYRLSLGQATDDFLSFGVLAFMDKAGAIDQKMSGFYPAINYNKCLSGEDQAYLSFGFTGGLMQYAYDPAKSTFNNQFQGGYFNPANPTHENLPLPKMNYSDIGAGMNFNVSPSTAHGFTFIAGAAAYHLNQPLFTYYKDPGHKLNLRWNLNASLIKELSDAVVLQLHANYAKQGNYNELISGGLIGLRTYAMRGIDPVFEFYAGAFYRNNDAIAPVVKMIYKKLSIGMSYDVNVSGLAKASNSQGGLELTVSFTGNYPPVGNYKKSVCPRF